MKRRNGRRSEDGLEVTELKGDVHPIQCPVNALGEVNEDYTYGKASRTADVTDGEIKKNHLRHLPLGLSVYKLLLKAI